MLGPSQLTANHLNQHSEAGSETLLPVVFVTDAEGHLTQACDSSLRFLRLRTNSWRGVPWHANLGDTFNCVIDAWNNRDRSIDRLLFCKSFCDDGVSCKVIVVAFEKSTDGSSYLAVLKSVSISLSVSSHVVGRIGGRYETVVFSVPDRNAVWSRFNGSSSAAEAFSVGSWDQWLGRILPAERDEVRARLERLVSGDCDSITVKCRLMTDDGRIEFLDCRFYSVVRDVSGMAIIVKADSMVACGAGKSSLELHLGHHLLDHVQESVIATDLNGIIHYWGKGAEKLYGWSSDEAIGNNVTIIVPECEVKTEHERMQQVMAKGSWSGRYRQTRKDGSTFLASSHISLVRDKDGNPIGLVGIDNDITEWFSQQRKITEMQSSLASAQWLSIRGELLAGCCHELCQPVFAIQNIISAVRRTLDSKSDPERAKQLLAMCSEEVTRAAEISDKLRGYASRPHEKLDQADPRRLLEDCGAIGRLHAELAGVDFDIQIVAEPCDILCDEIQLRHVVINLLRNAFDSLNDCDLSVKRVLLRGEIRDSDFVISVIDNGIGVPEHAREKLFAPFFTTKRNGTGVGLAMCRSIVETHGGELSLVRSAPYAGAHFEVALPLHKCAKLLPESQLSAVT